MIVGLFDSFVGMLAACLSIGGVFVFALSGALAAARRGLDLFGIMVVAYLPALGGGTLRDIALGKPANWIETPSILWVPFGAAMIVIMANRALLGNRLTALLWADALGMAAFATVGAQLAFELTHSVPLAVVLGLLPAAAGGILRDIVLNELPLVLHSEIYALAAALGAGITGGTMALGTPDSLALSLGFVAAFGLRALGIIFQLKLPKLTDQRKR